jgi:predicted RNase H-like HicB family nuclease
MLQVPYTSQFFREGDLIIALCPELNVSSFGETPEEALFSLQEAVTLFLETCQEMGTLEMVLEEAGYRRDEKASHRLAHIRTNMTTAGMSRERYFELLEQAQ